MTEYTDNLVDSPPVSASEIDRLWSLGRQYRIDGKHLEAINILKNASLFAQQSGSPLLAAQVQIGIIDSLAWVGKVPESIQLANQLIGELGQLGSSIGAARAQVNLGNVLFRQDEFAQALTQYSHARESFAVAGDEIALARSDANIANSLTQLGLLDEAIRRFDDANTIFVRHHLELEEAMGHGNVGWLEYVSGRYTAALSRLQKARLAFENRDQAIEVAKADLDIGDIYRNLNLFDEAKSHYLLAINAFRHFEIPYELYKSQAGFAAVLASTGDPDSALAELSIAQAGFQSLGNRAQFAHSLLIRSQLQMSVGDIESVIADAKLSEKTFRKCRLSAWAAEARFIHVSHALDSGQDERSACRRIANVARKFGRGRLEARAEFALGKWELGHGLVTIAIRHLLKSLTAIESGRTQLVPEEMHVAFLSDKMDVYESTISALLLRGMNRDIDLAFAIVERSKSSLLLSRMEAALIGPAKGSTSQHASDLTARLEQVRVELNRTRHTTDGLDSRLSTRLVSLNGSGRIAELEIEYNHLLRQLDVHSDNFFGATMHHSKSARILDIQALLSPDEIMVEFFGDGGDISAFAIEKDRYQIVRGIAKSSEIQNLARELRFQLRRAGSDPNYVLRHQTALVTGVNDVLGRLYNVLWRSLNVCVDSKQAGMRIIIIPHGPMHGLPFHAFHSGTEYVIDIAEISYSPSAMLWMMNRNHQNLRGPTESSRDSLVMAISAPGIERVMEEGQAIANLLPRSIYRECETATAEEFVKFAPNCDIIHLATHAHFRADNPIFSSIRFANSWMSARDLYELRLNCRLVTLSACQTGVSGVTAGDEIFGLVRGFMAAGARNLLVSYWPADDEATCGLMSKFYTVLHRGARLSEALRNAQIEIRNRYPHPYHWAAFVVVGGS